MKFILLPDSSPLISLRFAYNTGSVWDLKDRAGTAHLLARLIEGGGTAHRSFKEILDTLFPLASSLEASADKEMTVFEACVHADHIERVYPLIRERILEPGWDEADFQRVREDVRNDLAVSLRAENDEELGKEALMLEIYRGHPYGVHSAGTLNSLDRIAIGDLKAFHATHLVPAPLTVGIGGAFPEWLPQRIERDFISGQPNPGPMMVPAPPAPERNTALLIEKPARSVAISFGFPIPVTRSHPDFAALLLAASCLGQHRQSSGRLFQSMRQLRGLNYGDYAYIEYFPGGMYTLEPPVNLMRSQECFQIWIRPVEREHAHFALRLAVYELNRLVEYGVPEEEFERSRSFLTKYLRLMTKTKSTELGYLIDSAFHGIPPFAGFIEDRLHRMTREEVNHAIRRHLRAEPCRYVLAGQGMEELRRKLLSNEPSPMTYNAPKPEAILAEDTLVEKLHISFHEEDVRIQPVDEIFA